jgi:drug/metabolite transporter (DMT)-like permease
MLDSSTVAPGLDFGLSGMVEAWFGVALLAAVLKTGYSALQKRLTFDYDGLELSYVTSTLGLAFMTPIGAWQLFQADVRVTLPIVAVIVISGVANIGAIAAFLTALEREDLSVVGPLKQSTPIAVALTEPLVLAARYRIGVLLGAAAAVIGAYVLVSDSDQTITPLKRLADTPALLALAAALLFAIASLANRFVTTRVSPLFYAFAIYLFMATGFLVIRRIRKKRPLGTELLQGKLLLLGGVTALRTSVTYIAFSLAIASRVSVVLQLSILLNVLAGGMFFAEESMLRKLLGAGFIVAGIVLTL